MTVYYWMILRHEHHAIGSIMTLITTLLLSFLIVLSAIGAMAIGVMFGRGRIRGSCGGFCGSACERCSNEQRDRGDSDLSARSVVMKNKQEESGWR